MGENTKIQWAHHTFNPWRGCAKVAAGCANCYAESQSKRNQKTLGIWGPNGTRVVASEAMWREPVKWDHEAQFYREMGDEIDRNTGSRPESLRHRPRVFCASLADVFEDWQGPIRSGGPDEDPWNLRIDRDSGEWVRSGAAYDSCRVATLDDVRARFFRLIDATPHLDWLLLTKRPENIRDKWLNGFGAQNPAFAMRKNVWLGTSAATQDEVERNLYEVPSELAAVTFLSLEPLLQPIDLRKAWRNARLPDWVIVGGESGPNARPCDVAWIRSIVQQCKAAGVPVFVKQLGAKPIEYVVTAIGQDAYGNVDDDGRHEVVNLRDSKGGDPAEWPEDLRVREVPA